MKKYADAKFDDYRQKGKQELKEESADIRDFILRKKAESDEGAVRGIKDLETKLTNKWSTLFEYLGILILAITAFDLKML